MKTIIALAFSCVVIVSAAGNGVACNDNYFHVDDFAGLGGGSHGQLVPIVDNHSLWGGVRASQSGYISDGYGNNWDECWESCGLSVNPDSSIYARYWICYDTEPGYDFVYFDYYNGTNWTTLKSYNGGPACIPDEIVPIPGSLSTLKLRFRIVSDGAWSDEDGMYITDGAVIIDNISVYSGSDLVNFEDFECEAVGDQRTLDGIWVAGAAGACLDSIACVPVDSTASVEGLKYDDENGNGSRDPGEPGLQGWEIQLVKSGSVVQTATTGSQGDYAFTSLQPATYRISEVQQSGWTQTDPSSVRHTVTLQGGDVIQGLDFGNYLCADTTCWDSCLAGRMDNFNTSDGPESTKVSAAFDAFLRGCQTGRVYLFDEISTDKCFGYTFTAQDSCMTGCWGLGPVVGARLEIHLRAASGGNPGSDAFAFREDGVVTTWWISMNDLQNWQTGGGDPSWSYNDDNTFNLDLANLPQPYQGVTNILGALQDGDLDIYVQDDTGVDYIKLWVEVCDTTQACVVPPSGLRGWWGGDGNTSDYSVYANHGNAVGSLAYSSSAKVGSGAFLYDGSCYVEVPDNPSLDFGTATSSGVGNFSIDSWVMLTDTSGVNYIMIKLGLAFPSLRGFVFYVTSGKLEIMLLTAGIVVKLTDNSGLLVSPNQWTHVAVTVDRDPNGPMVRFYVNGQPGASLSAPQEIAMDISRPSELKIGPVNANGKLDEVELFAGILSSTDIMDMYLAGSAGKCHPAQFFVDCNNNGIDDLVDIANGTSRDTNGNNKPDECEPFGAPWGDFDILFCCPPFDSVQVDDVWVHNVGGVQFAGTIVDTCNVFDVLSASGPYTIDPGDSMAVVIRYSPTEAGTTTCIIGTGFYPGIICWGISEIPTGIKFLNHRTSWEDGHVVIRWTLGDLSGALNLEVRRREGGGGDFVLLGEGQAEQVGGEFVFLDESAETGKTYIYQVTIIEDGAVITSFETKISTPAPKFALFPNYPNPLSRTTRVNFSLDRPERVRVRVYNVTGRLVRTLVDRRLKAGMHNVIWNGRDERGRTLATGIYFYRLQAGARSITKKAVIIR